MPEEDIQMRKYEFKKAITEIAEQKGRGTELISLYIPPEKQIYDVIQYLREEYSTSSNIKSKSTRKNVLAAIESIMSRLKYYKTTPPTGLVFFVGHVATRGDQTEMFTKIVEPPEPIQTFSYKCDSSFNLDQLKLQLENKELYGLIVIDRKEATLGFLNGTIIQPIMNEQSLVPSKHHQGGQSSRRYERLIEIAAHEFFKKVGNAANDAFIPKIKDIKAVFVGGPGATKNYFLEKDYLRNEIKQKVADPFDLGYTDETGLRELVEKASGTIKDMQISREKELINKFMMEIKKPDGGLGVYGESAVIQALRGKRIDTVLVSEGLDKSHQTYICQECGNEVKGAGDTAPSVCPKCGGQMKVEEHEDIVEFIFKLAEESGAKVEFISEESEEGKLLKKAFGGIAGTLRYVSDSVTA